MHIPCEVIARLSHLRHCEKYPDFDAIRLERGKVIATNGKLLAVENVPSLDLSEPVHLVLDDALIKQCEVEAKASGRLDLIVTMGMVMCKSTFGYQAPIQTFTGPTPNWDRWREVIADAQKQSDVPGGVMVWDAQDIYDLARSSPSGRVEFPKVIDASKRCIVIRDSASHDWCGFFVPTITDGKHYSGAVVPGWV